MKTDQELYQQKAQAQLDGWKAELDKLKSKASAASADAQLELNETIRELQPEIEAGQAKLAELENAGEEAWESIKEGIESAWSSLRSAFDEGTREP
jgi:peptidoglycan hydrolase CwlO-like protein